MLQRLAGAPLRPVFRTARLLAFLVVIALASVAPDLHAGDGTMRAEAPQEVNSFSTSSGLMLSSAGLVVASSHNVSATRDLEAQVQALTSPLRFALNFGGVVLLRTVTKEVLLTNKVGREVAIFSIGITGVAAAVPDFTETHHQCGTSLAIDASCTILITFAPTVEGTHEANLNISTDLPDSPLILGLIGSGITPQPAVSLAPATLAFGDQIVNRVSAPQSVTLTNSGTADLLIDSLTADAGFIVSSASCPSVLPDVLPPEASCTYHVSCVPVAQGPFTGSLTLATNAAGSPHRVGLSCTGVPPGPVLDIRTANDGTNFGSVILGQASDPRAVNLTNTGTADLFILSISIDNAAEFSVNNSAVSNPCPLSPASLGAGLSCSFHVIFAPHARGLRQATLNIVSNAPGSPHSLQYSGRGTEFGPDVPGRWTPTDMASYLRGAGHTATLLPNGKILVTGATLGADASNRAELYDPVSGRWEPAGRMRLARTGHTATLLKNGKVLVAGGCACVIFNEPTAELFDPISKTWTPTKGQMNDLPNVFLHGRVGHTATLLDDGRVLVTGGLVGGTAPPQIWSSSEIYNPITDSWGDHCQMTGRGAHTATKLPTGGVLVAGGHSATAFLTTAEIFHPAGRCTSDSPQWTPASSMNLAHIGHTATLLPNGKVLVAGGGTGFGDASAAELYDVATDTWTFTGDLSIPRSGAAAVLLSGDSLSKADDRVLIAGGGQSANPDLFQRAEDNMVAEIYDPNTGLWSRTASMTALRPSVTLTKLDRDQDPQGAERVLAVGVGSAPGSGSVACTPAEIFTSGIALSDPPRGGLLHWTPDPLIFNAQGVGFTSPPQTVAVAYSCFDSLTLSGISVTAGSVEFSETNTCPPVLVPGAACPVQVTFSPAQAGPREGTIVAQGTDSRTGLLQHAQAKLQGTALAITPFLAVSPGTLDFGKVPVGIASTTQTISLFNFGQSSMAFGALSLPPESDFTFSNSCPQTLLANQGCPIDVTFTPAAGGIRSATLTIPSDAPDNPHHVTLIGEGVDVLVSPSRLSFGVFQAGTVSPAQLVTVTNSSLGTLNLPGTTVNGDFAIDGSFSTCPLIGTLLARQACDYAITFSPSTTGLRTGKVNIPVNTSHGFSTHEVTLDGRGAEPGVCLSISALAFAEQPLNLVSDAQSVVVSNCGTVALNIASAASDSAEFVVTNRCTEPVLPGGRCAIAVAFKPAKLGLRTGILTISSDAPGSPHSVGLSGRSVDTTAGSANVFVSFGDQVLLTESSPEVIFINNISGAASLQIFSIRISGDAADDFAQKSDCPIHPATLPVGARCKVPVTFKPTQLGLRVANLDISHSDGLDSIGLRGNGVDTAVALDPLALVFGDQTVGVTSAGKSVTVTNRGTVALQNIGITISGSFAQTSTCGTTLAARASCTVTVTFSPTAAGPAQGSLNVESNASGSPHTVRLTGNGILPAAPAVSLDLGSLDFGQQRVGTASGVRVVTLTNTGTAPLIIVGITVSGDFVERHDCGSNLIAGGKCAISVQFSPAATGPRLGAVEISTNVADSPHRVQLSGTGVQPDIAFSTRELTLADQNVGGTSAPREVAVTNTGTAPLTISSIAVSGDFTYSSTCPLVPNMLAAQDECVIEVRFTPTEAGVRTGLLTVTSDATGTAQQVSLSGTGILHAPALTIHPLSLTFSDQVVGTLSAEQNLTLTNSGTAPLNISSIAVNGDFRQRNTCGPSLAAGSSCTIFVNFAPTATGQRTGAVTIGSDAGGSFSDVPLYGNGLVAAVVQQCDVRQLTRFPSGSGANATAISRDGSRIALLSTDDLVGSNADGNMEVFLLNSVTNDITQITTSTRGFNIPRAISADGSRVVFESTADLNGGNPDGNWEVFVFDTTTNTLTQITKTTVVPGSAFPTISDDGTRIAFQSNADLTGSNPDANSEIFLFDTVGNSLIQVTNSAAGAGAFGLPIGSVNPSLNFDGTVMAFRSNADLTGRNPDRNDEVLIFDAATNSFVQVTNTVHAQMTRGPSISSDGAYVAFGSSANLTGANPVGAFEIFLFERATSTFTQISNGVDAVSEAPSISGDGGRIAFQSNANPIGANPDRNREIFLYDVSTGTLSQVTNSTAGISSSGFTIESVGALLDETGGVIAFTSTANATGGNSDGNAEILLATCSSSQADLRLTKKANKSVRSGGSLTYSITVSNHGPNPAGSVLVTDPLPSGVVFLSATPSQGSCTTPAADSGGAVVCDLGTLPNRGKATIDIDVAVTAPAGSVLTNTALVSSSAGDPNSANNSSTVTTGVTAAKKK